MNQNQRDHGVNDTYQTGSFRPSRSHSGRWASILVVAILIISLARTMGLLQLLQLQVLNGNEDRSSQFANLSATEGGQLDPVQPPSTPHTSDVTLELEASPEAVGNVPQSGGMPLQDIYEKNIDSVVSVAGQVGEGTVSGTGVVLSSRGYIVTNCHIVHSAQSVQVLLTNGMTYSAAIVGTDAATDLAVLYVDAPGLSAAEFGDCALLRVGDAVAAIGDPLGSGLRGTLTDGIISAINRNITAGGRTMTLLQTNAALNPGNSGGPLLNCYGQVIGINTMKLMDTSGSVEGIGFAIPSTTVKDVVEQLIRQGYVSGRPTLGIEGEKIDTFYQIYHKYPAGLYITNVDPDGNAAQQGLRSGDILLSLNNTPITTQAELEQVLSGHQRGDTLTARIYRSGKYTTVTLTVEAKQ